MGVSGVEGADDPLKWCATSSVASVGNIAQQSAANVSNDQDKVTAGAILCMAGFMLLLLGLGLSNCQPNGLA